MNPQHVVFRSKIEREREANLLRNYREIGIAAIAAASNACRKDRERKSAETAKSANRNERD